MKPNKKVSVTNIYCDSFQSEHGRRLDYLQEQNWGPSQSWPDKEEEENKKRGGKTNKTWTRVEEKHFRLGTLDFEKHSSDFDYSGAWLCPWGSALSSMYTPCRL